ncbi:serine/threonine-protein kinase [Sorangium sp. So ce233]|uniref:serine/threonine-protein kinase n=1 Tax=Sorangium sp. So ce233 TaxID=3133290 RepID=UPI003F61DCCE
MTSVDDLPGPGALFQGRFLIDRLLGRGGMGEVWAALDTTLERPVAIKIIHRALAGEARYADRFLREMKLVARVAHPNIVRLYDAGRAADGRLFMVMERVVGVPLREMIAGGARLDVVRALHYAIQIADALSTAHAAELVHRDVKPENILVSDGVHARLLDFGVAKDARGLDLTRLGSVVGTSRYMAPEQVAGSAVDARADVYALGVVLYEMLAGVHPYAVLDEASGIGETEIQAAHVHLEAMPLPEVLPACPEALWRAVATCLAKRPEERFARAAEVAETLREVARTVVPAEAAPENASARQLVSEAADAARERAIRERGSARRGEAARDAVLPVAALAVGGAAGGRAAVGGAAAREVPAGGAATELEEGRETSSADARDRLGMAQRFKVDPAWGLRDGVQAAKRTGSERVAVAARSPARALPVEVGQAEDAAAGQGTGPATSVKATRTVVSTERWDGAALAAVAAGEPLARTEPWEQARAGAEAVPTRAASSRARWALVMVLVLGLAALLAVGAAGLASG